MIVLKLIFFSKKLHKIKLYTSTIAKHEIFTSSHYKSLSYRY